MANQDRVNFVWAEDALTTIPSVPVSEVAYRDTTQTADQMAAGQQYDTIYNSARYNQLFFLLTSVAETLCKNGMMPFLAGQAYSKYARCIWTDGNVYRCSRDIAADESPYPTPKDESNVWSREEVLLPVASKTQSGIVQIGTGLDIDAGILSVSSLIESFRKSWIGVPRPWRSTTLPTGFVWANGSFVHFEDYPELEEVYDSGGFEGMLLPWDADEETIAGNLGRFRPDAAQPTGLFLPSLGGQFSRAWVPGQSTDAGREAGSVQRDAVQATWTSMVIKPMSANDSPVGVRGVTTTRGATTGRLAYEGAGINAQSFVATNAQRQADETRAVNVAIPHIVYLGTAA